MVDEPLADAPEGVSGTAWEAAAAAVRNYCGWHVAPSATETLTVDGSGASIQTLPTLHVTAIQSVIDDGREVDDPEWSKIGVLRARGRWTDKMRGVTVNLTHGYAKCPAEIHAILRDLASMEGRPLGASQLQAGPFSLGLGSASTAQSQAGVVGLSEAQKRVLDRYRISARP